MARIERWKIWLQGAVFLLCAACYLPVHGIEAESDPTNTADAFSKARDRVLQIQVIDNQADTKAGIGSGFFAGKPGWVVTNYHVIAELVNEPGKYRARFLAESGETGSLTLLAVDAVHDLALLATDGFNRPALELAEMNPPHGTRMYSLGYPFDIGLTIVEGTFNGMLEKSLYEKLHFTGSINPGMSGGPTINPVGQVVGINVSTAGNQVSFLVPVRFVAALLAGADGIPPDHEDLARLVGIQLLDNQERVSQRLLSETLPTTRLNNYSVPAGLAAYINCWGNSDDDGPDDISMVFYRCQTGDDIYLSSSLFTGIIRYQHDLISTEELNPFRFYVHLENRTRYPKIRLDGTENSVSNYSCTASFIDHSGLPLKVTFCLRGYGQFPGLYDVYLSATSLKTSREALQSTLVLGGFSWKNLSLLSSRFLESLTWQK
jgi:S1-C subfamily serine protease